MFRAKIRITLKKSIVDPQGTTVLSLLEENGFSDIQNVRFGKFVEMDIATTDREAAERSAEQICARFLVNPVIEKADFDLESLK